MAQIQHCCDCGVKQAAAAPFHPLAWELPCATGAALERQKNKIKKDKVRMLKYKLLQTMSFTRQDMPAKPRAGVNIGVRGRSEDSQVLGVRRQSRKERWSPKVPAATKPT